MLGRLFRNRRRLLGISREKMAIIAGIRLGTLKRIEHDKVFPTKEEIQALSLALDIHPDLLIPLEDLSTDVLMLKFSDPKFRKQVREILDEYEKRY